MPLLVLLFIVVPIVELFVIIQVGQAIGVIPTILLLLLSAVLGSFLLRSQGRVVWRRFNEALAERRVPHREVLDGVLVIVGGALLLTPGFVTDIVGILLLAPPTRAGIRRLMSNLVFGRVILGGRAASWGYGRIRGRRSSGPTPPPGPAPPRDEGYDYEGTAHEVADERTIDPPPREDER